MPVIYQRRPMPRVWQEPNERAMFESAEIGRCATCMRQYEQAALVVEDGHPRCPRHRLGDRSVERKAQIEAEETQRMAEKVERDAMPQSGEVKLTDVVIGSIRKITNNVGAQVYSSQPLRLLRTVPRSLLLLGRDFSAADTISGPDGMTITVSDRTATQTTLSITAGALMTPGDGYHLVFNGVYYRGIFSVR